ncbi:MAG: hypothetical protein HN534_05845 [Euryarchaeota archaeon]|jgi:hypothetical protein|nr:hypothetical protein [Euryarchaeota archaeon]MBT3654432.1 hypothetical protein [Euryarchaeota archaeon]MBT3757560.1 hypothetical protein [Euryarchaeota archaeon]MBT4050652.1 hypothetical protein [Euryarchaeota archaeon]MBT4650784.1 hypothetical protein [Euryarchaeota archaeon]
MASVEIATILLSVSSIILFWLIFRQRAKNRRGSEFVTDEYSGTAKDPDSLATPDEEALAELDNLLNSIIKN